MNNIHYYAKDPKTGIIYRTVGYTYLNEVFVYPKYVPDLDGKRGDKGTIKYRGINYPNGSVKFLASNSFLEGSIVNIKFSDLFHTFLPTAGKKDLILYDPTKRLLERIRSGEDRNILLRNLVVNLSKETGISINNFGLDASMLVGMDKEGSDIDLVVYGRDNANVIRNFWEKIDANNKCELMKPKENAEEIVKRRMSYSPLMTEEEIILWEECKISGYFKGVKFSIMPIDILGRYQYEYIPTGQFMGIRVRIESDEILCDPGILDLTHHSVKVVYGPPDCFLRQFITFLPSRMEIFLKKGDNIFIIGKVYAIVQRNNKTSFAVAQFPWDDRGYRGESYFVTKKEKCNLAHMIPTLLGLDFNDNNFTD
ncbi:hypothetical protein KBI33_02975 [Candidatus Shapirobacteria bacterium]|nr:hypothetical protein [Candidatus Shapirobacteria bacterium]